MSYGSGLKITANDVPDYNSLATAVNSVFADTNSGSTTEASANFGYGQTLIPLVSVGDTVTASQWNALFSAIQNCATHQGTSTGSVASSVSIGDIITAYDGSTGLVQIVSDIQSNRLNVAVGQSSTTSSGTRLSSSRATSWSTQLVHEFTVDFGSYNNARYFFNSGGQVRLSASRSGGTATSQNTMWSTMTSNMGTVVFSHTSTAFTGSAGIGTNIGFYNLTSSFQNVYSQNGPGGYTNASIVVRVRSNAAFGSTGMLRFRIEFTHDNGATGPDPVTGTFTSMVDDRRSVGAITISAPTYANVTQISAGT